MSKQFVTKEMIRHQRGIVRSLTSMVRKYEELGFLVSGDEKIQETDRFAARYAEIRERYNDALDQLIDASIKLAEFEHMYDKLIDREALSHCSGCPIDEDYYMDKIHKYGIIVAYKF